MATTDDTTMNSDVIHSYLDSPIEWKNLFNKIKHPGNLCRVIQLLRPRVGLDIENAIEAILQKCSLEDQILLHDNALVLSNIKPNNYSEQLFHEEKQELLMYTESKERQFEHAMSFGKTFPHFEDATTQNKYVLWMSESAKQGYPKAQTQLGNCYYHGIGVERNPQQAIVYYLKAAKHSPTAVHNLAICYEQGRGVTEDKKYAFELYLKASEQNYPEAAVALALCYLNGIGVVKNEQKGIDILLKYSNCPRVQSQLGICYKFGIGVTQDQSRAFKYFFSASQQNYVRAQFNLARCYEEGVGCAVSFQDAVKWYQTASDQGCGDAANNLGVLYEQGRGVQKDFQKAFEYYSRSSKTEIFGCCNIGYCYEHGIGVLQDLGKAHEYYNSAIKSDKRAYDAWHRARYSLTSS